MITWYLCCCLLSDYYSFLSQLYLVHSYLYLVDIEIEYCLISDLFFYFLLINVLALFFFSIC